MGGKGEPRGGGDSDRTGAGDDVSAPRRTLCNHTLWPHAVRYSRLRGEPCISP